MSWGNKRENNGSDTWIDQEEWKVFISGRDFVLSRSNNTTDRDSRIVLDGRLYSPRNPREEDG
jgi:hypothetical protein